MRKEVLKKISALILNQSQGCLFGRELKKKEPTSWEGVACDISDVTLDWLLGSGVGSEEVSYRRRGILFHPHAERIKKLSGDTSEDDGKGLGRSKRAKRESIPGRNSNEKQKKHKVAVVAVGPMEEILKLPGRDGRLAKWAVEVWTYDISYIQRKEAEGSVVKKFFGQEEQVQETPDANEEETSKRFKQKQP
ncbi:hypothetical protein Tco_0786722 [Tanacetum coccineum]